MQVQTNIEISDAEWEVMRIVWTLGQATTHTLVTLLEDKMNWKATTTKTLISRLVKKGALVTQKDTRPFVFKPTIAEQPAIDAATTSLFHHLCQMRRGEAINHLVDDLTLSRKDIEQLQVKLQDKLKSAPESVPCDCLPDDYDAQCHC